MQYHKVIPAPWLLILATVMLAQPLCLLFLVRIIRATGKPLVIPNWKYSLQWWRTVAWSRHPHKTGRGGHDYRVYRRNQKERRNKMENSVLLKRLQKWRNCGEREVFFTFLWMSSRTCFLVLNNRSSQCRIELPEWDKALQPFLTQHLWCQGSSPGHYHRTFCALPMHTMVPCSSIFTWLARFSLRPCKLLLILSKSWPAG